MAYLQEAASDVYVARAWIFGFGFCFSTVGNPSGGVFLERFCASGWGGVGGCGRCGSGDGGGGDGGGGKGHNVVVVAVVAVAMAIGVSTVAGIHS